MEFNTSSLDNMVEMYRKKAATLPNKALNKAWVWIYNDLQILTPVHMDRETGAIARYPEAGNYGGTLLHSFTGTRHSIGSYTESSVYEMSGRDNPAAAYDYALEVHNEEPDYGFTKDSAETKYLKKAVEGVMGTGAAVPHEPLLEFIANDLYLQGIR